jgi:hypothetical protein
MYPRDRRPTREPIGDTAMTDDKRNVGSPDRDRINLGEDYEVQYWSKELRITPEKLRSVVEAVGPSAKAVREHLGA